MFGFFSRSSFLGRVHTSSFHVEETSFTGESLSPWQTVESRAEVCLILPSLWSRSFSVCILKGKKSPETKSLTHKYQVSLKTSRLPKSQNLDVFTKKPAVGGTIPSPLGPWAVLDL